MLRPSKSRAGPGWFTLNVFALCSHRSFESSATTEHLLAFQDTPVVRLYSFLFPVRPAPLITMAGALSQREIYRELCKITEPTNPEKGRFSCVGYAPTQGRRCWNIVNSADISSFEAQLRSFTEADLRHPDARSSKLRAMAGHGLCVRYHRKTQITEIASRWDHEITIWLRRRAAVEQQSPRVSERPRARVSPNTSASSPIRARETGARETHSPRATAPTTVQEAYNTPREEIIETVERTSGLQSVSRERIRATLASSPRVASFTSSRMSTLESLPSPPRSEFTFTAQRQPIAVNSSHAPGHVRDYAGIFAPSRPRIAVLAGQTGAPSTTVPVSPPQAHPTTTPVQQATSPAAIPEGVPSPVDSVMIFPVAPTAPPAPEPAPCTQDHARRKTTDDECPICQSSWQRTSSPISSGARPNAAPTSTANAGRCGSAPGALLVRTPPSPASTGRSLPSLLLIITRC